MTKEILVPQSTDSFVAKGVFESCDNVGICVNEEFRRICTTDECSAIQFSDYISAGEPAAYLMLVVSNSLKFGFNKDEERFFDGSRIAPYIFDRRAGRDIFNIVEQTKAETERQEARNAVHPLMLDMADFLMLAMSVYKDFLKRLGRNYTDDFLEDKTARYYGQSAVDLAKTREDDGLERTLRNLSKRFDVYNTMMKWFAANCLEQKVIRTKDIAKLNPELKKELFEEYNQRYWQKRKDYTVMAGKPIDLKLLRQTADELNELGKICAALNNEFKHEDI